MKDPLTKAEKWTWFNSVKKKFNEKYEEALACGVLDEYVLKQGPYLLAMSVLQITAKQFEPTSSRGKEMLENLEHFI